MPHRSKQWYKKQERRFKRKIRRQRESEKRIETRREMLSQRIGNHLAQTGEEDPWLSLERVLKEITKNISFEALFKHDQRDPSHFKKGITDCSAKVDRDAVGPKSGNYHLAFFAFAPQFKGKPHSHQGVNCVSAVLKGPLQEKLYSKDETDQLKVISDEQRSRGSVVADFPGTSQSEFIHSVSNPSKTDIANSLHVYKISRGTLFNKYYAAPPSPENKQPATKRELKL
jgi:hypothetical protein